MCGSTCDFKLAHLHTVNSVTDKLMAPSVVLCVAFVWYFGIVVMSRAECELRRTLVVQSKELPNIVSRKLTISILSGCLYFMAHHIHVND